MSSRDQILGRLRAAQKPFTDVPPVAERRHMVPGVEDMGPAELQARFMQELDLLGCTIYCPRDNQDALNHIVEHLGDATSVLSWDDDHLPVDGLSDALQKANIKIAEFDDGEAHVGISGADAALAATGSVIVSSGPGKFRTASLLPDIHIAVVDASKIVADFETWAASQKAAGLPAFRKSSNTVIITGPSKTADIAQILIKGAHGPRKVHIVLVNAATS
ncbi:MAG: lactate utilization protein [Anaerolineaceae bacterium]|nr:lactate utilization protein [Anaerolineaceae bacterium]